MTLNLNTSSNPAAQQIQENMKQNFSSKSNTNNRSSSYSSVSKSDSKSSPVSQYSQGQTTGTIISNLSKIPIEFVNQLSRFKKLAQANRDTESTGLQYVLSYFCFKRKKENK